MRSTSVLLLFAASGCTDPLAERSAEPDVAIPRDCGNPQGAELELSGAVVDFATGQPIAGARVDITEKRGARDGFPTAGCRIGGATTDSAGRYGPLKLRATEASPTVVFLVTGAGRAPTISDTSIGCLFGCSPEAHDIRAPAEDVVTGWRDDLYAGGMEYALNRGLVAYTFHDAAGRLAFGVEPYQMQDSLLDNERHALAPGAQVRFVESDRLTLAAPEVDSTRAGIALIGAEPNAKGYFRVGGERGEEWWAGVSVIVATGWIFVESDTVDPVD